MNSVNIVVRLEQPVKMREIDRQPYAVLHPVVRKRLPMLGSPFYDELDCEAWGVTATGLDEIKALPRLLGIEGHLVSRQSKSGGTCTVLCIDTFQDLGPAPDNSQDLEFEKASPFIEG